MRQRSRRIIHKTSTQNRQSGFSLVELSVVVTIIGVVAILGLESAANFVNRGAGSVTRERLVTVDDALARFFKIHGRLPCPAPITTALTTISPSPFGVEDCAIVEWGVGTNYAVKLGGGLMYGMLPYRTLNLPLNTVLDGFNNKLNYVVTKNLVGGGGSATVPNRFGSIAGTTATDGLAGIEIRTGTLREPCNTTCQKVADPASSTGAAYIVFSSGPDQRGAIPVRGTAAGVACATATVRVDAANCKGNNHLAVGTGIAKNVFYDNRFNAGLNLSSYFDDYVVWRPKSRL